MTVFHLGRFSRLFQRTGLNVGLNNFYSPIPDVAKLEQQPALWQQPSRLPGVAISLSEQQQWLKTVIAPYTAELATTIESGQPATPYRWANHAFGPASAFTLYGVIRQARCRQIIEVGSGYSTAIAALAARQNRRAGTPTKLTAIEPYPNEWLKAGLPGVSKLITEPVQAIKPAEFERLGSGDLLFIDSSHVSKMASDVNYLYLEILPRLKRGVIVHVHDIFFPYEYPRDWVIKSGRFWNEQYLLQAFLAFNDKFQVRWSGSWMADRALPTLKRTLPKIEGVSETENYFSSSFYFQRV